jgi:hypothetical protein
MKDKNSLLDSPHAVETEYKLISHQSVCCISCTYLVGEEAECTKIEFELLHGCLWSICGSDLYQREKCG